MQKLFTPDCLFLLLKGIIFECMVSTHKADVATPSLAMPTTYTPTGNFNKTNKYKNPLQTVEKYSVKVQTSWPFIPPERAVCRAVYFTRGYKNNHRPPGKLIIFMFCITLQNNP
eukprot:GHVL01014812.1.p1 GENE.GHVL01014812.1~~GHVL01014812.1.p1  ORF type:complete len:114 (+),score=5.66 GHVL01014812.1:522-863(+)